MLIILQDLATHMVSEEREIFKNGLCASLGFRATLLSLGARRIANWINKTSGRGLDSEVVAASGRGGSKLLANLVAVELLAALQHSRIAAYVLT